MQEIGHEAYQQLRALPDELVASEDFWALYHFAYEDFEGNRALCNWLYCYGEQGYLRGLREGLKPTTIYYMLVAKGQPCMLREEDGVECLLLFGEHWGAIAYQGNKARLDTFTQKDVHERTGEFEFEVDAWEWKTRGVSLEKLREWDPPILLDPTLRTPGRRMTVAGLEEGD